MGRWTRSGLPALAGTVLQAAPSPNAVPGGHGWPRRGAIADRSGGARTRCFHHDQAPNMPSAVAAEFDAASPHPPMRRRFLTATVSRRRSTSAATVWPLCATFRSRCAAARPGWSASPGSGKTTLAPRAARLTPADAESRFDFEDRALARRPSDRSLADAKALQIVFQNPDSALNRSHTSAPPDRPAAIGRLARSPAPTGSAAARADPRVRLADPLSGCPAAPALRRPNQRRGDRPSSRRSQDRGLRRSPLRRSTVSVQAAILTLLPDCKPSTSQLHPDSHDSAWWRYLSDRIAVLYLGRLMQIGAPRSGLEGPHHPIPRRCSRPSGHHGRQKARISSPARSRARSTADRLSLPDAMPRKLVPLRAAEPPLAEHASGEAIRCHIPLES